MDTQDMDRIPSFSLDHDTMQKGFYLDMQMHGISTWDLRMKTPNAGDYITPKALHSIEHIIATVMRNSDQKDSVIYFGPMGCRTGFYLLTVGMTRGEVLQLCLESFQKAADFTEVPGSKKIECGNYLEHDLDGALRECRDYLVVLDGVCRREGVL